MFNPEELALVMEAQAALYKDNQSVRWMKRRKKNDTNAHTSKQPVSDEVRAKKRAAQKRARKANRRNKK